MTHGTIYLDVFTPYHTHAAVPMRTVNMCVGVGVTSLLSRQLPPQHFHRSAHITPIRGYSPSRLFTMDSLNRRQPIGRFAAHACVVTSRIGHAS